MSEMPKVESLEGLGSLESTEKWIQPQKGECEDCGEVSKIEFGQTHCRQCGGRLGRIWVVWPRNVN